MGGKLRHLRSARGFSLGALSDRAGVHKATLSRWESGVQRPSIPELEATLVALEAPAETRQAILGLLGAAGAPRALRLLHRERRGEVARAALPPSLLREGMPGSGSLLRALRSRRGWSQEQLASHLRRHVSVISRWERGDAWPSPDLLQPLCVLLGATAAETAALMTGTLTGGGTGSEGESVEAVDVLEHRFRSHLAKIDTLSELYPAMDLAFIALEASLWAQGIRRAAVRPLLAEVYSHHANYLRNASRFVEGGIYAEKALALIRENPAQWSPEWSPDWTQTATVCIADAAAKGMQARPDRGEAILRTRLAQGRVPVPYAAWMLRKIANYQFAQGRFADAEASLQASSHLSKNTAAWGDGLL